MKDREIHVATLCRDNAPDYIKVKPVKLRCPNTDYPVGSGRPCRNVLARGEYPDRPIEIKCRRCKMLVKLKRL